MVLVLVMVAKVVVLPGRVTALRKGGARRCRVEYLSACARRGCDRGVEGNGGPEEETSVMVCEQYRNADRRTDNRRGV